jgi:acylphosphatase
MSGRSRHGVAEREAVRRHLVVHGRVQGVGFRAAVHRAARAAGVAGFVANRPDGSVEAVFEGPPDAVERAVRACSEGPRGAHVSEVDVRDEPPQGLSGFEVR